MDHDRLGLTDKIALLGELEHIRRHALRSAKVAADPEEKYHYEIVAFQARDLRRRYQEKNLETDEKEWCLVKAAASLKQLTNELTTQVADASELENFTDTILSHAFGKDLSGCEACHDDEPGVKSE